MTYDDLGKLFARVSQLEQEVQALRTRLNTHTHDRLEPEDRPLPSAEYEGPGPSAVNRFG